MHIENSTQIARHMDTGMDRPQAIRFERDRLAFVADRRRHPRKHDHRFLPN